MHPHQMPNPFDDANHAGVGLVSMPLPPMENLVNRSVHASYEVYWTPVSNATFC